MDYRLLIIIAIILVVAIAATRTRVVYEIQGTSLLLFGSSRPGLLLYSLFFLPGTLLHELSHWLMAELLQVPTGKLTVLPDLTKSDQGENQLGFVMTGKAGPFRGFLIGFAPFLTGLLVLFLLGYFLNLLWGVAPWWQVALLIYSLIVVGNSMMVSREDRRSWPLIAILSLIIIFISWRLNLSLDLDLNRVISPVLTRLSQVLLLTIALNLGMIMLLYALRRVVEKITKKKVVLRR